MIAELVALRACPVAEEGKVQSFVRRYAQGKADPADAALRRKIAEKLKGDVLLTGSVNTYTETFKDSPPSRRQVNRDPPEFRWGYTTTSAVDLSVTAKLVDVNTGSILWIRKAHGGRNWNRWVDPPYPGEKAEAPKEGWGEYVVQTLPDWAVGAVKGKGRGDPHLPGRKGDPHRDGRKGDPHRDGAGEEGSLKPVVVNIHIQNTQTQQQTQTASAQANASASGGGEAEDLLLLYEMDSDFAKLRDAAIREAVAQLTGDFKGRGGWTPQLQGQSPAK